MYWRNRAYIVRRCALPTKRRYSGVCNLRLVWKSCVRLAPPPGKLAFHWEMRWVEKNTPLVMPSVHLYNT